MKINNIVFYYPSRQTGGTQYLFLRCADALVNNSNYKVFLYEYPDGFARNNIKSKDVILIDYNDEEIIEIPDNTLLIVQMNMIYDYSKFRYNPKQSAILFWALHRSNLKYAIKSSYCFLLTRIERAKVGKGLLYLTRNGVMRFMAYSACFDMLSDFFVEPPECDYLPNIVPLNKFKAIPSFKKNISDEIKFCWLGRLDLEKSRNIVTYMNELEVLHKTNNLSLSIIGLGPQETYLKQISSNYSYNILFVGEKRNEDLDMFLRNETEVGLASGTSAFEFSLRGKPVISDGVLDRVYEAGARSRYIYTYEIGQYYGNDGKRVIRKGEAKFAEKINYLINNYEKVSKDCYNYVMAFSPENCCIKLKQTITQLEQGNTHDVLNNISLVTRLLNKGKRRYFFLQRIKAML